MLYTLSLGVVYWTRYMFVVVLLLSNQMLRKVGSVFKSMNLWVFWINLPALNTVQVSHQCCCWVVLILLPILLVHVRCFCVGKFRLKMEHFVSFWIVNNMIFRIRRCLQSVSYLWNLLQWNVCLHQRLASQFNMWTWNPWWHPSQFSQFRDDKLNGLATVTLTMVIFAQVSAWRTDLFGGCSDRVCVWYEYGTHRMKRSRWTTHVLGRHRYTNKLYRDTQSRKTPNPVCFPVI